MNGETVVAIISAVIAVAALALTARQVRQASEQTKLQREQTQLQHKLQRDASQPYVWADIRLHEQHGQFMMLVLRNEGPTVANEVTMRFDPPLPQDWRAGQNVGPTSRDPAAPGVYRFDALPPGRIMQWNLGIHTAVLGDSTPTRFTVTIDATGPFGPVDSLTYSIEIADYRDAAIAVPGTPLSVARAIKEGTKLLDKSLRDVANRLPASEAHLD